MSIQPRFAAIVLSILLGACSGGGSGTTTAPPVADPTPRLELFVGVIAAAGGPVGTPLEFFMAGDIAADRNGNLYVAYADNAHRITPAGAVSRLANNLFQAEGVAVDLAANVYLGKTTPGSNRGAYIPPRAVIRRVTPQGADAVAAPVSSSDGTPLEFGYVGGLASDGVNLYISDLFSSLVLRLSADRVLTTLAGIPGVRGGTDRPARGATFNAPRGLAVDSSRNVFVVDQDNHAIRRISVDGTVSTLAGRIGIPGHADGTGDVAMFNRPSGIAIDAAGNLYVADLLNHVVRKVTPAGIVSTVVGIPGVQGFVPGSLPGVLNAPIGVAVVGNDLYITMLTGIAVVRNRP